MTEARTSLAVEIKDRTRRGAMSAARSFNTIKRNAASANKQIVGFGKSMTGLGGGMSTIGRQIGTGMGFAALAGFVTNAVGEFIKFEKAMLEVKTLLPAASNEMGTLTQNVRDLAKEFGTDTQVQAKALYQTISAGAANAAEAQKILNVANKLAIGGVTDVATAVDGLTTALNAYGYSSSGAISISNQMFIAMKAGKTTIPELSQSLSFIAPVASQTGVSMGEVLAATAALTKAGVPTQRAMRGLAQTIAMIIKPSSEAAKMAETLNEEAGKTVIQFNAAALEALGLTGFLEMVGKATGGSAEKMAQLFGGVESLLPVLALTGTQADDLRKIFKEMQGEFKETDTAYGVMADSISHKTDKMRAEWNTFVEDMGKGFTEGTVTAIRGYKALEEELGKIEAQSWKNMIEKLDKLDKLLGTALGSLFADETRARLPTHGLRGMVQDAGTASWDAEKGKWREPPEPRAYGLPADRDMPRRERAGRDGTLLQPVVDALDKGLEAIAAAFPEGEFAKYVDRQAELPGGGGLSGISQYGPRMGTPGQYLDPEKGLIDVGEYGPEDWSASLEDMLTGWSVVTDEASGELSEEVKNLSDTLAALSGGVGGYIGGEGVLRPPGVAPEDGEPKETDSQRFARQQKEAADALSLAKKTADEEKRIAKETTTAEEMLAEVRRKTAESTFELSLHGLSAEVVQQKRLEQFQQEEIAALGLLATGDEKQAAMLAEHELQRENLLQDQELTKQAKEKIQIAKDTAGVEGLIKEARARANDQAMSIEQQELARVRAQHVVAIKQAGVQKATKEQVQSLNAYYNELIENIIAGHKGAKALEDFTDEQQTLNRIFDEATGIASRLAPELSNMFNAINAFAQKDYIGAASSAINFIVDIFSDTNDEAKNLRYTFDELSSSIRSSVSSAESAILAHGGAGSEEIRKLQMDTVEPMLEFFKQVRGGIEGERRSELEDFREFIELMGLLGARKTDLSGMDAKDITLRKMRINEILANFMDAFVEGSSGYATAPQSDYVQAKDQPPYAGETDEERFYRLERDLATDIWKQGLGQWREDNSIDDVIEALRSEGQAWADIRPGGQDRWLVPGTTGAGIEGAVYQRGSRLRGEEGDVRREVTYKGQTAVWEEGFGEGAPQVGRGDVEIWRELLESIGVAGYRMSDEMQEFFEIAFGEDTLAEIAVNMFSVRDAFNGITDAARRLVPTSEEVAHRLKYRGQEISAGAEFADAARLAKGDVFERRQALIAFQNTIKSIRSSMSAAERRLGKSGVPEQLREGAEPSDVKIEGRSLEVVVAPDDIILLNVSAAQVVDIGSSPWEDFGVTRWNQVIDTERLLTWIKKDWADVFEFTASKWEKLNSNGGIGVTSYDGDIIDTEKDLATINKDWGEVFTFTASPIQVFDGLSYDGDIITTSGYDIGRISKNWGEVFDFHASKWGALRSNGEDTGVTSYKDDIIKNSDEFLAGRIETPWGAVFSFRSSPWKEIYSNSAYLGETPSWGHILHGTGLTAIEEKWGDVFMFDKSPWSDILRKDGQTGITSYSDFFLSRLLPPMERSWGQVFKFTAAPWGDFIRGAGRGIPSFGRDIIDTSGDLGTINKPWAAVFKFIASPWSALNSNNATGSLNTDGWKGIIDTSGDLKTIPKPWAKVFKFVASPWSELNSNNSTGSLSGTGYSGIIDTSGDLKTINTSWASVFKFTKATWADFGVEGFADLITQVGEVLPGQKIQLHPTAQASAGDDENPLWASYLNPEGWQGAQNVNTDVTFADIGEELVLQEPLKKIELPFSDVFEFTPITLAGWSDVISTENLDNPLPYDWPQAIFIDKKYGESGVRSFTGWHDVISISKLEEGNRIERDWPEAIHLNNKYGEGTDVLRTFGGWHDVISVDKLEPSYRIERDWSQAIHLNNKYGEGGRSFGGWEDVISVEKLDQKNIVRDWWQAVHLRNKYGMGGSGQGVEGHRAFGGWHDVIAVEKLAPGNRIVRDWWQAVHLDKKYGMGNDVEGARSFTGWQDVIAVEKLQTPIPYNWDDAINLTGEIEAGEIVELPGYSDFFTHFRALYPTIEYAFNNAATKEIDITKIKVGADDIIVVPGLSDFSSHFSTLNSTIEDALTGAITTITLDPIAVVPVEDMFTVDDMTTQTMRRNFVDLVGSLIPPIEDVSLPKFTIKVEDIVEFDPDFSTDLREIVVDIVKEAILDRDIPGDTSGNKMPEWTS